MNLIGFDFQLCETKFVCRVLDEEMLTFHQIFMEYKKGRGNTSFGMNVLGSYEASRKKLSRKYYENFLRSKRMDDLITHIENILRD